MEKYFKRCIELAKKSDCTKMHFGSVIAKNDKIIGEGYNHCADKSIEDLCNPCIRKNVPSGTELEKCTAVHAEQASIIDAYKKTNDLSLATLYVCGEYPSGKPFLKLKNGFYCSFCSRLIKESAIKKVVIRTVDGPAEMSIEEVLKSSYEFAQGKRSVKKES